MDSPPRRHHYVPAFYLAQFTIEGSRNGRLFVFDQHRLNSWLSTPDGTAHQRDFYAIDIGSDVHPATFEAKVLSELDGKSSSIVHKLLSDKEAPTGEDLNVLLNFVAVSMARIPRTRQLVDQVASHEAYEEVKALISTEEDWQHFLSLSQNESGQLSEEDARKYRQSILDGAYDITLDNTSHVQQIIELVDQSLPLLADRRWSVGFAAENTPDFVCSDVPVSLAPNSSFTDSDVMHLANNHTYVLMPLSRRAALIGSYEEWPRAFRFSESGVLSLNSLTIRESNQVFSTTENFAYQGVGGRPAGKEDLIRALKSGDYSHSTLQTSLDAYLNNRPPQ